MQSACNLLYNHVRYEDVPHYRVNALHIKDTNFNKCLKIKYFSFFLRIPSEKFIFVKRIHHEFVLHTCLTVSKFTFSKSEFSKT
jgi:hypothetical protein